eukprot:CAMPEP_0114577300 /NCGR_PEP_ID=MMETSP0125-20121206/1979_1 /TAXON_ID=485358 ORGANISM="Aristerostoma sp., Strain ATCC 50986" /NCGR_SAMPLE_ID=MMETSP0125 /ASSEMBLY_ACC=CAM_ASM_000245 /LENGTH=59 /DNA_ID=CAMNT_0001766511 /DNA_START=479 /DNA_END=658 /DNA_ORIENTATION=+
MPYTGVYKRLTPKDDEKLEDLKEKYGDDWVKISDEMGGMDPIKARNRYYSQKIKKKVKK